MAFIAIIVAAVRLVRLAKANQIRCQHAVPGGGERGNKFAVEIGPGRLSMQQQDRRSVAGAFIDIMQPQGWRALRFNLNIMCRKRIVRKVGECGLGRAQDLHGYRTFRIQSTKPCGSFS